MIYPGEKVMYVGCDDMQVRWGNNDDPRLVLNVGKCYDVKTVTVKSQHTKVELKQFPKMFFNSVSFESIEENEDKDSNSDEG